ncbi:J domain-containing protein [Cellulomonas alba]|uniref:DnaJ domain-containing protein n=1 Tax=Cellulomonas alba TaxID=3053467 RepID=A0ABT7SJU4_9CELL|nr:DnaJ domain-containing protein [Cellulomonas alba]MDM7855824.1 DnaJ domain-containing protein [Cellulomonas alba]
MSTAYDVLGVSPDATQDELRRAYRSRARRTHPDAGGTHEDFVRVSQAWDQVRDAASRAAYDGRVRASRPTSANPDVAADPPAAEWGSREYFRPGRAGNNPRPRPAPQPSGPYPPPGWRPPTGFSPRTTSRRPPTGASRPGRRAVPTEKRWGPRTWRGALLWWPISFVYWWTLLIAIVVLSDGGRDVTGAAALMLFGWLPALRYFRRLRTWRLWVALGLVTSFFAAVAYLTQWSFVGGLITMAGLVVGVELVRQAVLSSKEMLLAGRR